MQAYSNPKQANDPYALPDVEVFNPAYSHRADKEMRKLAREAPGWYYWFCFPGCLPDSDPVGPFESEAEALADAQKGCNDGEE